MTEARKACQNVGHTWVWRGANAVFEEKVCLRCGLRNNNYRAKHKLTGDVVRREDRTSSEL